MDEAGELGFTTAGLTKGNPLYGAAAQNQVLTDGAYGVRKKLSWLGVDLPLPQDVVARFVESPDDISGQLAQYNTTSGILDPKSSLTTGDDFFADSSKAAHDGLSAGFSLTSADTLFPPGQVGWTKSDLLSHFFQNTAGVPDIGALYAHYNPWLAQPAGSITSLADLASTADVPTGTAMNGRILFTIGCHSGLNIPDFYDLTNDATSAVRRADWAQAYAKARAAVYIANSGYGYEDDVSMALSGRLMALFAQKLNRGTGSIGEQWTDALDTYFRTAGDWDVLDEKVMLEATFYGPPWAHFASSLPAPAETPPATGPKDGLTVASLTASPTLHQNTGPEGTWWDVNGQTLSVPYRSIQPLYTKNVTVPNMHAHDAFITDLQVHDVAATAIKAYPTIDRSAYEPNANYKDIFWPAIPTTVLHSPSGDTLNVVMGQFRPGSSRPERLIDSISVDIAYTTASDDIRPLIKQVGAVMNDSTHATIFVRASDESGPLNKVAALYNDGTGFKYQELTFVGGDLWKTSTPVTVGAPPEVIGEARDSSGNVGVAANKAANYTAITDTSGPSIVIDSPLAGGVFTLGQQVPARYACSDPGGVASCSGPVAAGSPIDTFSVGTKTFTVNATDLSSPGHTAMKSVTYSVRFGFLGFFQPVDNLPTLNTAKPGSTIAVKWKLQNSSGVDTTSLEAVTSISSREIKCPSATVDAIETTVPASLFPLKYDAVAKQYVYNWQTDKAWSGKCRRIFVAFSDGTYQAADFQFK